MKIYSSIFKKPIEQSVLDSEFMYCLLNISTPQYGGLPEPFESMSKVALLAMLERRQKEKMQRENPHDFKVGGVVHKGSKALPVLAKKKEFKELLGLTEYQSKL